MEVKSAADVARLAAEVAIIKAAAYLEKERQRPKTLKMDWRLRNTKLLLRHYREFVVHCEEIRLQIDTLDPEVLIDFDSDILPVESIKQSKAKTLVFVNFVQQMMHVYQVLCERSIDSLAIRRYKAVEMMYIAPERYSAEQIAYELNVDQRTVYKDINKACDTLSTLLFGVDGARLIG